MGLQMACTNRPSVVIKSYDHTNLMVLQNKACVFNWRVLLLIGCGLVVSVSTKHRLLQAKFNTNAKLTGIANNACLLSCFSVRVALLL